jgi:hypothetical protein
MGQESIRELTDGGPVRVLVVLRRICVLANLPGLTFGRIVGDQEFRHLHWSPYERDSSLFCSARF